MANKIYFLLFSGNGAKCEKEGGKVKSNGTFCVLEKGRTFSETENFCSFLGATMPVIKSDQEQNDFNLARGVSEMTWIIIFFEYQLLMCY